MVSKFLGLGPKTMLCINEKHVRAWRSLTFWREVSPGGGTWWKGLRKTNGTGQFIKWLSKQFLILQIVKDLPDSEKRFLPNKNMKSMSKFKLFFCNTFDLFWSSHCTVCCKGDLLMSNIVIEMYSKTVLGFASYCRRSKLQADRKSGLIHKFNFLGRTHFKKTADHIVTFLE